MRGREKKKGGNGLVVVDRAVMDVVFIRNMNGCVCVCKYNGNWLFWGWAIQGV